MSASVGDGVNQEIRTRRGLTNATINAVTREGSDLIVHVENGFKSKFRSMYGTVVFVEAGTVQSTDLRNPAFEQKLEAGWKIHQLVIGNDTTTLEVGQSFG